MNNRRAHRQVAIATARWNQPESAERNRIPRLIRTRASSALPPQVAADLWASPNYEGFSARRIEIRCNLGQCRPLGRCRALAPTKEAQTTENNKKTRMAWPRRTCRMPMPKVLRISLPPSLVGKPDRPRHRRSPCAPLLPPGSGWSARPRHRRCPFVREMVQSVGAGRTHPRVFSWPPPSFFDPAPRGVCLEQAALVGRRCPAESAPDHRASGAKARSPKGRKRWRTKWPPKIRPEFRSPNSALDEDRCHWHE